MEIREYIQFARRWWWLVLLGALVSGAGAFFYYNAQQPVYRASTLLLVSEGDVVAGNEMSGIQLSERLAQSYVERLKTYAVLESAIGNLRLNLDPNDLARNMQVRLVGNTQLIELSVEHTDPAVARDLANEIPEVFAQRNNAQQLERFAASKESLEAELAQLQDELARAEETLQETSTSDESDPAEVERLRDDVLRLRETHSQLLQSYEDIRIAEARALDNIIVDQPARLPQNPVRPQVLKNTALLAVAGALAAVGAAFLIEYLDNTVQSPLEAEQLLNAPVLGAIREMNVNDLKEALIVQRQPRSPTAEAYRHLRTNLFYSLISRNLNTILVTSANPGEGKTTTAANLALALVQAGHRVILVDSDLRRPALHRLFNVSNRQGLTDFVLTPGSGARLVQRTEVEGLHVLTSGPLPPNPAEMLGSERMEQVTAWLAKQADYVVYDSPPMLAVTDAAVLSRFVDTTVVVVQVGQTTQQALLAAANQLQAVGSNVAGAVLNRITRRAGSYGGSYNYYYYANGDRYGHAANGQQDGVPEIEQ